jgi:beta-N-acetylhexosaminidase
VWFTPTFSKHKEQLCGGCQLHVTDREAYQPIASTLSVLRVIQKLYPEELEFHASYFDKVMGTSKVLLAIESGASTDEIVATFKPGLEQFSKERQQYLLYR